MNNALLSSGSNFLSQKDLKDLTGLQRPSAVVRWLDNQKIRYLLAADGWPRVLRVTVIERLGFKSDYSFVDSNEPKVRLRHG